MEITFGSLRSSWGALGEGDLQPEVTETIKKAGRHGCLFPSLKKLEGARQVSAYFSVQTPSESLS